MSGMPVGGGARGKWVREKSGPAVVLMRDGVVLAEVEYELGMEGENYGHGLRCPCAECARHAAPAVV